MADVPTQEQVEFGQAVFKEGSVVAAAREWHRLGKWGDVTAKTAEKKGYDLWAKDGTKAACEAAKDYTEEQFRALFQLNHAGLSDRIAVISDLINSQKTPAKMRLELIQYADKLEGRTDDGEGNSFNVLEAIAFRATRVREDGNGTGLPGVRAPLLPDPNEIEGSATVLPMADAGGQGDFAPAEPD
jgi:hypothetical protein